MYVPDGTDRKKRLFAPPPPKPPIPGGYTPIDPEVISQGWPWLPQGFGRQPPPGLRLPPGEYTPAEEGELPISLTPSFLYDYPGAEFRKGRELAWQWRGLAEKMLAMEREARGAIGEAGATLGQPARLPLLPSQPSFMEQWQERWPGRAMEPALQQWAGKEVGWTRPATETFKTIPVNIEWPGRGGGGAGEEVFLGAPGSQVAAHEFAHKWYRQGTKEDRASRDRFCATVQKLADETDPRYRYASNLARDYVYGNPFIGFKGLVGIEYPWFKPGTEAGAGPGRQWSDEEMYAGLASGIMGNLELLPSYMHEFYEDIFTGEGGFKPSGPGYPSPAGREESDIFPPWAQYRRLGEFTGRLTGRP